MKTWKQKTTKRRQSNWSSRKQRKSALKVKSFKLDKPASKRNMGFFSNRITHRQLCELRTQLMKEGYANQAQSFSDSLQRLRAKVPNWDSLAVIGWTTTSLRRPTRTRTSTLRTMPPTTTRVVTSPEQASPSSTSLSSYSSSSTLFSSKTTRIVKTFERASTVSTLIKTLNSDIWSKCNRKSRQICLTALKVEVTIWSTLG